VIEKSLIQAKNFSFLKLQEIYKEIFKLDSQIKTGKIEKKTALFLLVSKI
jgi:DNA polymerase III delta subunit